MGRFQKLGINLENFKIGVIKNVNNKKFAPKLVFFNEKKLKKFRMIFDIEMDFDSQILALFDASPLHQFSKFNSPVHLDLEIG